jgi:hypothetical protein
VLADGGRQRPQSLLVGDSRQVHPGGVVAQHGAGLGPLRPVDGGDLALVLPDADQQHPLVGAGRGHQVQPAQRRDVRRLVEQQQQRRVQRQPGGRAAPLHRPQQRVDQGLEDRGEQLLVARRRHQVQRAVQLVEAAKHPTSAEVITMPDR